jgi:tRNA(Arg) A34 adenosine deaminase TadA
MVSNSDSGAHETYIERACELAREAANRGDDPYGSLLVYDDEIIMEATNRTRTDDDVAAHPELALARRAAAELDPEIVSETVMYTSTEPCPMCSTGMSYARLGAVVYSVSGAQASEIRGGGTGGIPCDEVFDRLGADINVVGPVLPEEGKSVHHSF